MSPHTVELVVCGLYVLLMIYLPFPFAQETQQTTQWIAPVKQTLVWYILSIEGLVSGILLSLIAGLLVRDTDASLWLLGAAFALTLAGVIGTLRCRKRLESLQRQYPRQR
jgi:hypothetical protein